LERLEKKAPKGRPNEQLNKRAEIKETIFGRVEGDQSVASGPWVGVELRGKKRPTKKKTYRRAVSSIKKCRQDRGAFILATRKGNALGHYAKIQKEGRGCVVLGEAEDTDHGLRYTARGSRNNKYWALGNQTFEPWGIELSYLKIELEIDQKLVH